MLRYKSMRKTKKYKFWCRRSNPQQHDLHLENEENYAKILSIDLFGSPFNHTLIDGSFNNLH